MDGVRILVVDDHPGFRACVRRALEREGYSVVGEAGDCASAMDSARELAPEIALVDVHLPDGDGFDLAHRLRELGNPPAVVLTSSRDGSELEDLANRCGACGFIPKDDLSREAIEELAR